MFLRPWVWSWALKRRARGEGPLWILKTLAIKGLNFSFEWEKTNFATFGPLQQILEKSPRTPVEEILPTLMSVVSLILLFYKF